jgi:transposase
MDRRKLEKLRRELEGLRRRSRSIRSSELESLAKRLGRSRVKRGKEPTYERSAVGWFPLTIPSHPGSLAVGTACSILDQLEEDIERLEAESVVENGRGENVEEDPV